MLRTRLIAGPVAGLVLAVALASVMTAIASAELLVPRWRVLRGEAAPVTLRLPPAAHIVTRASSQSEPGVVEFRLSTRHALVLRGEVPDGATADVVEGYEASRRPLRWRSALGLWLIYFLLGLLNFTYLRRYSSGRGRYLRTHIGLTGLVVTIAAAAKAMLLFTPLSAYFIPSAVVPLWAALYVDRRAALLLNFALAFLIGSLVGFDVALIAVFLARGMASTLVFRDVKHPSGMVLAGLAGGLAGAVVMVAYHFHFTGGFALLDDVHARYESALAGCVGGGLAAGLLGWMFHGPAGLALGGVSRAKLVDLSDLEHPLLKKMAAEAPGSWQHSRAMANLAEDAAAAIGADAMLTRIGAYYHDLGKTIQCKYFVENLAPGEPSPHEDLDPDVSADAIMAHVVGGVKILREAGIPEPVVEFAYTHHGSSVIEYFWHKCQQQGNPKGLTVDAFRYPGMRPQTRETAILMLIDAIEAASRTIDPPDHAKYEEMVQRVIFSKLKQGQLDDSGLSLEDLRVLSTSIAERLVSVYHHRIKYPWQNQGRGASLPAASPPPEVPSAPAGEAPSARAVGASEAVAEPASSSEAGPGGSAAKSEGATPVVAAGGTMGSG